MWFLWIDSLMSLELVMSCWLPWRWCAPRPVSGMGVVNEFMWIWWNCVESLMMSHQHRLFMTWICGRELYYSPWMCVLDLYSFCSWSCPCFTCALKKRFLYERNPVCVHTAAFSASLKHTTFMLIDTSKYRWIWHGYIAEWFRPWLHWGFQSLILPHNHGLN